MNKVLFATLVMVLSQLAHAGLYEKKCETQTGRIFVMAYNDYPFSMKKLEIDGVSYLSKIKKGDASTTAGSLYLTLKGYPKSSEEVFVSMGGAQSAASYIVRNIGSSSISNEKFFKDCETTVEPPRHESNNNSDI